ncbi:MAG: Zinc-containing alcohol dehydrogenase superfamily [Bradyrhizobium sp.]|nr:Zinc-containing alcohol dehydrogenase superfamily [Bradyrhizobium sp.]
MKAIDLREFGGPEVLKVVEVPAPEPRAEDLLVRNYATGVNRADLTHRRGGYGRVNFGDSEVIGLEVAGEVIGMGADVEGFALGDRVMGVVGGGGYAEIARIDARTALRIPDALGYVHAAAVSEAFVTAHEAMFHLGRLEKGETIVIHAAASGVGTAGIQMARAVGARIIVTAGGNKLDQLAALGADVVIDRHTQDFAEVIRAETKGEGVDVVIDFIGAPYFERNIESLKDGGRLVQVGLMGGFDKGSLRMDRLVLGHLHIMGTVMKSRTQAVKEAMARRFGERWLPHLGPHGLMPVIDSVLRLDQAPEAHRRMESNQNIGKIVLTIGDDFNTAV